MRTALFLRGAKRRSLRPLPPLAGLVTALCAFGPPRVWAAPVIFNATESARPGEVIGLQGHDFGDSPEVWVEVVDATRTGAAPGQPLPVLNRSSRYASARIPADYPPGLYAAWVKNTDTGECGSPVYINRARAATLEFNDVSPGGTLRIFGRNLRLPGATPAVRFVSASGESYAAAVDADASDPYVLKVAAPTDMDTTGTSYQVRVSNGYGGCLGESQAEETVRSRPGGPDPFDLQVPWGAEFAPLAGNVYNVRTDPRLRLHAAGDGVANDRDAVQAAIDEARADGGGVVYLPEGTYKLEYGSGRGLSLPSRIVLQGDGMDRTFLTYGHGAPPGTDGQGLAMSGNTIGLADLTLRNVDTTGTWFRNFRSFNGNAKIFLQRIRLDTGAGEGPIAIRHTKLVIAKSVFEQKGKGEIFELSGSSEVQVRGNTFRYHDGRMEFSAGVPGGHHVVIEDNTFVRDAAGQVVGNGKEAGGPEFSGVKDIALLGNIFDIANRARLRYENDGETILSQYSNPSGQTLGTVTGATETTLVDAGKRFGALSRARIVAIVDGVGTGQWRRVAGNTAMSITVTPAWDVTPAAGSRYVVTGWADEGGAVQGLIKGNLLADCHRGIWFYTGGADVAIVENRLTNSEGIHLVADQRDWFGRFNLLWNLLVADNVVENTDSRTPAYIGAWFKRPHNTGNPAAQRDLHGTGVLGVEFRRNTLRAGIPNRTTGTGGLGFEGYYSYVYDEQSRTAARDTDTVGTLGTIFDGNTAINTRDAYRLGTGACQTVIWGGRYENAANRLRDDAGAGTTQRSKDTAME